MRIGDTPDTVDELPARSVRHGRTAGPPTLLAALVLLVGFLIGCGGSDMTTTAAPPDAHVWRTVEREQEAVIDALRRGGIEITAMHKHLVTDDIHRATWSKLDTTWTGVSIHTLLEGVDIDAGYVTDVLVETPRRSVTDAEVWGR